MSENILKDLKKKMVFIGGPRQVGKTTLAKHLLEKKFPNGRYFNWDYADDRHALLAARWQDDAGLVVFDELHKYRDWKSWIKGIYDTSETKTQFLVTGSVRHISLLDLFIRQLRTRVGSLIVLSNLAGEIQVSPKTTANWLDVLERMYLVFAVRPYTTNLKHPYSSGKIKVIDPIGYFR